MSKKPHKVDEPQAPYPAKKPVKVAVRAQAPTIRYASPAQAKKAMDKVFRVHSELLRKLAQ